MSQTTIAGGVHAPDEGEPLLDYAAAAERLNVSVKYLQTQVQRRKVPHRRLGSRVRFAESDIAAIIAASLHAPVRRGR